MDFKEIIAKLIYTNLQNCMKEESIDNGCELTENDIKDYIEVPKEESNGDYAFPCFRLAKILRQAPNMIADKLKAQINDDVKAGSKQQANEEAKTNSNVQENKDTQRDEEVQTNSNVQENDNTQIKQKNNVSIIEKVESISGYLNFYIDKSQIVKQAIELFDEQKDEYGKMNIGEGKKVLVEYSSPNIAKPFHIGHLKTTIIGNSLYKIYKNCGFETLSLNHLGDYGTQFAKLIEGYKRWGKDYDLTENPIDKLSEIYKKINELCEQDENVLEECRETFKKLEDGDEYCVKLWNEFKELSLKEFQKIYELLNVKFDSYNGEAFYSDKMQEVIDILEKNGRLIESQGARVVDLEDKGIKTPCIIQKANGSSIYATRDLAAILYRARTYDYDKCIYVVGEEQNLHFKQIFEVAKYLDLDEKYTNGLEHVSYGMIMLPEGKMSTRKGNFVKVEDLLNESIAKAKEIMQDRNLDNKDVVSKQVGIGAVIFEDLKESRIKNQVFDLNEALNFNGETGPYVQYMAVRTKSVLEKALNNKNSADNINENSTNNTNVKEGINYKILTDDASIKLIKLISSFKQIILNSLEKNEPSIITRYSIDVAKAYGVFYDKNKIISDDQESQNARLYLTYMTKVTLENSLKLLGIEVPDKM